jgi:hypothetical protein
MMKSWREELVEARTRQTKGLEPFTERTMRRASWSWLTCAVGEQHRQHPALIPYRWCRASTPFTNATRVPRDDILLDLGGLFTSSVGVGFGRAVLDQDVAAAERALDAIEDHVLRLKRQFVSREVAP